MEYKDWLIGNTIDGRYLIEARLARGGMASVYRAFDHRLARRVAVKIIHPHLAEQTDFTQRFIKEAQGAAALNSPHIVSVHDQGITPTPDGERAFLVMELIEGPDLRNQLRTHGSFTLGQTLDLLIQILRALSSAHQKQLIHRDVKPENILLNRALVPGSASLENHHIIAKVADFGLVRAASDSTGIQTSTTLGTVAYIAPEIVTHNKITPSADVYAVGVMFYEMLAGKLPFSGTSPMSIAYSHVNNPIPRLSELADWIPPAIDSTIALFTAKDPQNRPAHASEALTTLVELQESISPDLLLRRIPVFPNATDAAKPAPTVQLSAEQATTVFTNLDTSSSHRTPPENTTSETDTPVLDSSLLATQAITPLEIPTANSNTQTTLLPSLTDPTSFPKLTPPSTLKKKRRIFPVIAILGTLLFLGVGGTYLWNWWFTQGPGLRVTVVDVLELPAAEATSKLNVKGFKTKIVEDYSDTIAQGLVISTDPKAGTRIHPSNTVTLTVSLGIEHLVLPNVTAQTKEKALATLKTTRFTKITQHEEWSEEVPQGEVIRQSPEPGASIPHNSPITLVISKGREPLTVPDLSGITYAEATTQLEELGLSIEATEEFSDSVAKGTIISQDVAHGETRYRNDVIKVVVSKGPEMIAVPNVVGLQESQARSILESAGFAVTTEKILGGYFGTVRLQSPGAGEKAKIGSTIKLTIV